MRTAYAHTGTWPRAGRTADKLVFNERVKVMSCTLCVCVCILMCVFWVVCVSRAACGRSQTHTTQGGTQHALTHPTTKTHTHTHTHEPSASSSAPKARVVLHLRGEHLVPLVETAHGEPRVLRHLRRLTERTGKTHTQCSEHGGRGCRRGRQTGPRHTDTHLLRADGKGADKVVQVLHRVVCKLREVRDGGRRRACFGRCLSTVDRGATCVCVSVCVLVCVCV